MLCNILSVNDALGPSVLMGNITLRAVYHTEKCVRCRVTEQAVLRCLQRVGLLQQSSNDLSSDNRSTMSRYELRCYISCRNTCQPVLGLAASLAIVHATVMHKIYMMHTMTSCLPETCISMPNTQ